MYILQAFDELLLLQRGGSTLYCGPVRANAAGLIGYFESMGADKINPGHNPATWILDITSASAEQQKGIDFAAAFENSSLKRCRIFTCL